MKYYRSYHLTANNILESIEDARFYLKVYYADETGGEVGESFDSKGNVNWVIYFSDHLTSDIKKYHAEKYSNADCSTCRQLTQGVLITFYESDFEIAHYLVETYHPDGSAKVLQEFNSNFELTEYREEVYSNDNVLIEEKIFYPESWTIHREKMI